MILTTIFALFETISCEYETIFNDSAMLFSTTFNVLQCSELVHFNDLKKSDDNSWTTLKRCWTFKIQSRMTYDPLFWTILINDAWKKSLKIVEELIYAFDEWWHTPWSNTFQHIRHNCSNSLIDHFKW